MFKIACMKCGAESIARPYYEHDEGTKFYRTIEIDGDVSVRDPGPYSPEGIEFRCEKCGNVVSEVWEFGHYVNGVFKSDDDLESCSKEVAE